MTLSGIEFVEKYLKSSKNKKKSYGVLCHPSSVTNKGRHLIDIVDQHATLKALFGPQHGIDCETQDNMIEWQDFKDSKGRPVYSLYGETRKPTPESLQHLDSVIVDLFDVGARLYTYIYTLSYMMEACAEAGVELVICDRPNPIGGKKIEGSLLDLKFQSFVGLYEIPMVHGMTIAELAQLFASRMKKRPQLHILKIKKWTRDICFPETKQTWTLPSPNMPSYQTAEIFPGLVFLEATSLSEGRGTTRPFELIGAPFFKWDEIEALYNKMCKELDLLPVRFHRQSYIPTFHKFAGEKCSGALQILPRSPNFKPVRHGVILLWVFRKLYGDLWSWKQPPYEYEYEKLPIDILAGGPEIRECVDQGLSLKLLFKSWQEDEIRFRKIRKEFLIYS